MIAYFVHNKKERSDTIVLPDMRCSVPVDTERLLMFISVTPNFGDWSGDACSSLTPEDFGTIVATRDECGDVQVIDGKLWQERMGHHLGS